ncbi:MAG TPA: grasp-with-spasm system ATP-grasp peptide maturase [Chitinophaga sp.]|uniref:grasp-with-spasm system ATP-grasp peptide maturase n=1 Tax=Chitinophaga sp. TaxID=1869181 RepID=UPI002CAA3AB8|nr:grasp-with-spasm system ATP-grasp peptide maturase [Chitinophaga sp.]HVI49404.1 grasp-with-spasm system ATP-grasp peptide maturase [Chitinophaga sp.]
MILIFSRQDDGNTGAVTEWLRVMGKDFVRLNADDERTRLHYMDISNNKLMINQFGREINLCEATAVWFRRKGLSVKSIIRLPDKNNEEIFHDAPGLHREHVQKEMNTLVDFIYSYVSKGKPALGTPKSHSLNKLEVMLMAQELGLQIPRSYMVTSKAALNEVLTATGVSCITKAMSDGVYRFTLQNAYYSYTERIGIEDIDSFPETFFPSLIQLEIRKKYELRVFFLKDTLYAMAIFSQNDNTTVTDFRKYNQKRPNRTVPYKLPDVIEDRLRNLMQALSLNTGSIDLIVDEREEYIFLEVNPVGQFGMTSQPCNYYLEKKIAQLL